MGSFRFLGAAMGSFRFLGAASQRCVTRAAGYFIYIKASPNFIKNLRFYKVWAAVM
jgi:hypothetical protein